MSDDFEYKVVPSDRYKDKTHIIIVGGGIIGVCTAYYLVKDPNYDHSKYHISILESAKVAGGASGKAGGLLGTWAFPKELSVLSFKLHEQLAKSYGGDSRWGYRKLPAVSIEADLTKLPERLEGSLGPKEKFPKKSSSAERYLKGKIPSDFDWIDTSLLEEYATIGNKEETAQVHPYKFTTSILKEAIDSSNGSLDLILGRVTEVTYSSSGVANGVKYLSKDKSEISLEADSTIVTSGPWTPRVLPDCPISSMRAHSITIEPYQGKQVSGYALFTELHTGASSFTSPEIYARPDEVYACGEGDTNRPLPETSDKVEVIESKCDEIFDNVGKISSRLKNGTVTAKQACYLPTVSSALTSGPFVGATNVKNLFVASGHSVWGINNSVATGKLMSEIILKGKAESSNIKLLSPKLYFDAKAK